MAAGRSRPYDRPVASSPRPTENQSTAATNGSPRASPSAIEAVTTTAVPKVESEDEAVGLLPAKRCTTPVRQCAPLGRKLKDVSDRLEATAHSTTLLLHAMDIDYLMQLKYTVGVDQAMRKLVEGAEELSMWIRICQNPGERIEFQERAVKDDQDALCARLEDVTTRCESWSQQIEDLCFARPTYANDPQRAHFNRAMAPLTKAAAALVPLCSKMAVHCWILSVSLKP